jgi:hypothetical protein
MFLFRTNDILKLAPNKADSDLYGINAEINSIAEHSSQSCQFDK